MTCDHLVCSILTISSNKNWPNRTTNLPNSATNLKVFTSYFGRWPQAKIIIRTKVVSPLTYFNLILMKCHFNRYKNTQIRKDTIGRQSLHSSSVTRLGDLLDFGQILQSLWQQLFCLNHPHFKAIFKGVKIFHFSSEIIFRPFYRHLAIFYWSHYTAAHLIQP